LDEAIVDGCGLPRQMKREAHGFSRAEQVTILRPKMSAHFRGWEVMAYMMREKMDINKFDAKKGG
jgi:hypothetical protein